MHKTISPHAREKSIDECKTTLVLAYVQNCSFADRHLRSRLYNSTVTLQVPHPRRVHFLRLGWAPRFLLPKIKGQFLCVKRDKKRLHIITPFWEKIWVIRNRKQKSEIKNQSSQRAKSLAWGSSDTLAAPCT